MHLQKRLLFSIPLAAVIYLMPGMAQAASLNPSLSTEPGRPEASQTIVSGLCGSLAGSPAADCRPVPSLASSADEFSDAELAYRRHAEAQLAVFGVRLIQDADYL